MNKYIFHGGASTKDEVSNQNFFREFVKDIPENGNVLLVYFASRDEDCADRIAYDTQMCAVSTHKKLNIIVANKDSFIEQVLKADALYLRGGSTEKLITTLSEYPEFSEALKNKEKTIAGSSAGAYALSTYFASHYEDRAVKGLEIVPVRVVTHFESLTMSPKAGAVEALKATAHEVPLIILKETEWSVIHSK